MPIALHQKHDDSCKPIERAARTEFTKDSSSAALPFTEHHRTGRPVCSYFSQPRLYLVYYNNTLIFRCQYILEIFITAEDNFFAE